MGALQLRHASFFLANFMMPPEAVDGVVTAMERVWAPVASSEKSFELLASPGTSSTCRLTTLRLVLCKNHAAVTSDHMQVDITAAVRLLELCSGDI